MSQDQVQIKYFGNDDDTRTTHYYNNIQLLYRPLRHSTRRKWKDLANNKVNTNKKIPPTTMIRTSHPQACTATNHQSLLRRKTQYALINPADKIQA